MWSRSRDRRPPPAFTSPEARAERERERWAPRPGDQFYVHLADLRDALKRALEGAGGTWLDLGADTSPYRGLLGGGRMLTAERPGAAVEADITLDERGNVPVPDGAFAGVLSTQVLEHVPDVAAYLAETRRVLEPGGRLVLTTHGIWEDHPGPLDLRRWTLDGLARELSENGFDVVECRGLTCRRRAALFLLQQQFLASPRLRPARRLLDVVSDRLLGADRDRGQDALLYLGILIVATARG